MKETVFCPFLDPSGVVAFATSPWQRWQLAGARTYILRPFGFRMRLWKVVGGSDGGILVRKDRALDSEMEEERLEHGAIVHEVQVR